MNSQMSSRNEYHRSTRDPPSSFMPMSGIGSKFGVPEGKFGETECRRRTSSESSSFSSISGSSGVGSGNGWGGWAQGVGSLGSLAPSWLPSWQEADAFARRHGLGTFWLPLVAILHLSARSGAWFGAHAAAVGALSLTAHLAYAAMLRWPLPPGASLARTIARCAAGCMRWMGMPLVVLHCLLGGPPGQRLSAAQLLLPLPLQRAVGDNAAFVFAAAAFLLFRLLQAVLWMVTSPPLPSTVVAAAAVACSNSEQAPAPPPSRLLRVLIVGDSIPPKVDGVAVRAGHLIRALTAAGHVVHIVYVFCAPARANASTGLLVPDEQPPPPSFLPYLPSSP